jgi:excisionase family DNA binding protein
MRLKEVEMLSQAPNRLLLRPSEAAEILGISRSQIYALIANRSVPIVRVGKRARVPLEGLKSWIGRKTREQQKR